ncbi:hypothetical protein QBZ16_003332 [Prototheca wickerhamii]|uniref:OCEL domain-containing protein n=1 Tax=Prototheca wickerhamii TaxID=3111 RepID=A0AAD9IM55_PROWI|nr:hypothetical protein QBZ16_003332 [Prototheca wickerhamii]
MYVLEIGQQEFPFTAVPETGCEVLQAGSGQSTGSPGRARLVAQVQQKLILRRSLGEERGRMRARAEEAERKQGERRAVVLAPKKPGASKPVPGAAAPRATVIRRGTSEGSLLTLGGTGQPRLTSSASRPTVAVRQPTPPPPGSPRAAEAEDAARARPASAKRLRLPSPAPADAPLPKPRASAPGASAISQAVRTAAQTGSLRAVLLAGLGERPMSMAALRAFLPAAAAASGGAFQVPASRAALERAVRSVASLHPTGRYHLLAEGDRPIADEPAAPSGALSAETGSPSREDEASGSPEDAPAGPATARVAQGNGSSQSPEARPSTSSGSGRRGGKPPLSSSSSASRGLSAADEAWLDTVVEAGPRAVDPVATPEEFEAYQEEFNSKYETYFRLHQLIQASQSDFAAWKEALKDPNLPAGTREKVERKVEERWRKQAGQAQRWDAAFRILHEELEGIKSQLHRYVQTVEDAERMSV